MQKKRLGSRAWEQGHKCSPLAVDTLAANLRHNVGDCLQHGVELLAKEVEHGSSALQARQGVLPEEPLLCLLWLLVLLSLLLSLSFRLHLGCHLLQRVSRQGAGELPEDVMDDGGLFQLQ